MGKSFVSVQLPELWGGACAQAPTADVHAAVSLTERARGSVSPASLTFLASNWAQPQARSAQLIECSLTASPSWSPAGRSLMRAVPQLTSCSAKSGPCADTTWGA